MNKKTILISLKVLVSVGIIWWLLATVDMARFWSAFSEADIPLLLLGILAQLGVFLVLCLRYWVMLDALHRCPLLKLPGSYYAGIFANNFLPTGVGGDVIRSWRLRGLGIGWDRLLSSSLVDRVLGLISILFLGLCGIAASDDVVLDDRSQALVIIILLALPVALVVLFSRRCHALIKRLAGGLDRFAPVRFLFQLLAQCAVYQGHIDRVLLAIGLTLLLQSLTVAAYWLIGLSIGIELSLLAYFAIVPIVVVVTNLPISLGGIGVREGAAVALLMQFGVDQSLATANAIGYLGVLLLTSLPGGLVLLTDSPAPSAGAHGESGRTVEANVTRNTERSESTLL